MASDCGDMPRPFVLAQLSDPHIGATWAGGDSVAGLRAVVASAAALRPDAVVVTGDLSDHATDEEYARARELLAPLGAPLYVLPGNHDERAALRRCFSLPGEAAEPVQYAADVGPLRLVVLDSTRPGRDDGELSEEGLAWLDATLATAPAVPTLVAMHHPPILTGTPEFDAVGIEEAGRRALADVLARHPQVRRVIAGHVHRVVAGTAGGCGVLTAPSSYVELGLDLEDGGIDQAEGPAGFVLHVAAGGDVASHLVR